MIQMVKDGQKRFVPDIFIDSYRAEGYVPVGEEDSAPVPTDTNQTDLVPGESSADSESTEDLDNEEAAEAEVFVCPVCGKEYKSQAALDKHIASKHPEA